MKRQNRDKEALFLLKTAYVFFEKSTIAYYAKGNTEGDDRGMTGELQASSG